MIKVLMLTSSYIWGDRVNVVEVKENKTCYTYKGTRYTKEVSEKEPELLARKYGYAGGTYLYKLDSDYARSLIQKQIEENKAQNLLAKINERIKQGLTYNEAKQIAIVLGIEL